MNVSASKWNISRTMVAASFLSFSTGCRLDFLTGCRVYSPGFGGGARIVHSIENDSSVSVGYYFYIYDYYESGEHKHTNHVLLMSNVIRFDTKLIGSTVWLALVSPVFGICTATQIAQTHCMHATPAGL